MALPGRSGIPIVRHRKRDAAKKPLDSSCVSTGIDMAGQKANVAVYNRLCSGFLTLTAVKISVSHTRLCRGVAQSGSALEWGSRGRKFKSSRPDQFLKVITAI